MMSSYGLDETLKAMKILILTKCEKRLYKGSWVLATQSRQGNENSVAPQSLNLILFYRKRQMVYFRIL